jgi:hypothetical protein
MREIPLELIFGDWPSLCVAALSDLKRNAKTLVTVDGRIAAM